MKVIIIGSGEMLMNIIAGCEDINCNIVGVLRAEQNYLSPIKQFFKNTINPSKDFTYVKSHKIPIIKCCSVNTEKFKKNVLKLNPDIIIVASWGEKIKKNIIDLPKLCTINVHPSLLPKYRGPNPYIETIRNFEKESGVTFHLMNENFDTGEILLQKKVSIYEEDTGKELKTRITSAARDGIKELLANLDNDIIIPISQNEELASYYGRIKAEDTILNFEKTAKEVVAQIRALHPFSKAYFSHNTHFLIPNPYKLSIEENIKNYSPKQVYEVQPKTRTIAIVCADNKVIKMQDVKLFGLLNLLSDLYIKLRIKEGNFIN